MKYRSIVLSGPVAAGTTTAAKALSEKLNLNYKSAGDFFRQYMVEHNIALYKKEDLPDNVDRDFDDEVVKTLKFTTPIVFEGLYAGYFARDMKHVFKVLLLADENERIRRALNRTHTHVETAETVKARDKSHDAKFRKLYTNENFLDPKFFDLVIDTTHLLPEEVNRRILEKFNS